MKPCMITETYITLLHIVEVFKDNTGAVYAYHVLDKDTGIPLNDPATCKKLLEHVLQ